MLFDSHKCKSANPAEMCARSNIHAFETAFTSNILIVKQNRKNLKSPTHFCKMCGYGDFSSTRVRRHLLLRHHSLVTKTSSEKSPILADCLAANNSVAVVGSNDTIIASVTSNNNNVNNISSNNNSTNSNNNNDGNSNLIIESHSHSDSEPESPLSTKICDDLPEDLSVHSDVSASDNDENIQVVPQFKPVARVVENKKSVIVRTPKKTASKRSAPSAAAQANSILKRRLLGEPMADGIEASEASLNASELNVKMVYHNSKFVIDSSEAFWLKGYKLPPRYELAQQLKQ